MGHKHSRDPWYGTQEADGQSRENIGSVNIGKLSMALGNSYNLLKPQFPLLSN